MDADLRWQCWVALAAQGAAAPAELDAELAADDTMTGRRAHLLAVASRPGAAAREATWQRATTDDAVTNDELRALVRGFTQPADPPAPGYADRYFASLTGWWANRTMTMATILARGLFPAGALDPGERPEQHPVVRQARGWLAAHPAAPAALRRIVVEQLDDLERALRAQAAALRAPTCHHGHVVAPTTLRRRSQRRRPSPTSEFTLVASTYESWAARRDARKVRRPHRAPPQLQITAVIPLSASHVDRRTRTVSTRAPPRMVIPSCEERSRRRHERDGLLKEPNYAALLTHSLGAHAAEHPSTAPNTASP